MWNGQALLPEGWVARATKPDAEHLLRRPTTPYLENGYQYQWWTIGTGAYAALGVYGQFIYIDPARELVIVKASNWAEAWGEEFRSEAYAAFEAIARRLAERR